MVAAGTDPEALSAERWIDARYRGQSFELAVPAENWMTRFHDAHAERYGYARPESPVEAVTVRVVVASPPPPLAAVALEAGSGPPPSRTTEVILGGRVLQARRVRRRDLRAGHRLDGPAVIQEYSSTTWVPSGWTLEVDSWGCLHLSGGR